MRGFFKSYLASDFIKNAFTIFTGNVIAQAIPFLVEPVIARIYSPSDFAVLSVYLSVANLFSIIATGRYELAIMLPKEDKKAINLIGVSIIISLVVSVLSFAIVAIFNSQICTILHNDDVSTYLYLVPLSVLSVAWYQTFNYWNTRKKRFKNVAYSKTTQSVVYSAASIGLGTAGFIPSGLMISQIGGQFCSTIPLLRSFFKNDRKELKNISKEEMKTIAYTYRDFPKINSLHAFCDVLRQSGEVFLLSFYYVKEKVGLHSRTLRLLFAPSAIIGSAIGQVFYQKAAACYQEDGDLQKLVKKVLLGIALIAIPAYSIIAVWGDDLFAWFLGEPWRQAGEFGQLLTPWLCLSFITSPISQIPLIVQKQKAAFLLSLVGHALYLLAIIIGGVNHNIELGFILLSSFQTVYYIFLIVWLIRISKIKHA